MNNFSEETLAATALRGIKSMLATIGEDPEREGLQETPARVLKAFREMTAGYGENPGEILSKTFDVNHADELVLVQGIEFTSLCEHHLLPFNGTADVGYIPGSRVVGLSKIARLVECFAKRLQVQERLTMQIANAIEAHLGAVGVGVIIRAKHGCMCHRGVRKPSASMVTSAILGVMRDDPRARAEFLALRSIEAIS